MIFWYSVPPQVSFSTTFNACENDSLTINGTITGNPIPTSVWRKGETVLMDNDQLDVSNESLIFSSVQREDAGIYNISSTNSEGSANSTFTVDICCELHTCVYHLIDRNIVLTMPYPLRS